jgi:hypothetical protein
LRSRRQAFNRTGLQRRAELRCLPADHRRANFDLAIPGRKASFGVIKAAQARGDFRVLAEWSWRALHAHITHDPAAGLAAIGKAARLALA